MFIAREVFKMVSLILLAENLPKGFSCFRIALVRSAGKRFR